MSQNRCTKKSQILEKHFVIYSTTQRQIDSHFRLLSTLVHPTKHVRKMKIPTPQLVVPYTLNVDGLTISHNTLQKKSIHETKDIVLASIATSHLAPRATSPLKITNPSPENVRIGSMPVVVYIFWMSQIKTCELYFCGRKNQRSSAITKTIKKKKKINSNAFLKNFFISKTHI